MIIYFRNCQDKLDPDHGLAIATERELAELLGRKHYTKSFIAQFLGTGDFHVTVGMGGELGFVQYSRLDGAPPYLMAVSLRPPMKRGIVEFLCGATATPIAARYIVSFDELGKIMLALLRTGERSDAVSWQVFDPRACKEDAERPLES